MYRWVFLICWCCGFIVSPVCGQSALNQRVDVEFNNETVEHALAQISDKSGLPIIFSSDYFPPNYRLHKSYRQIRLKELLKVVLSPLGLMAKWDNNQIIISKQAVVKKRYFTISGYIEDAKSGERLIAANIAETSRNRGTFSNEYGFYSLRLPEGLVELNFSFLGYQTQEKQIKLSKNLRLNIALESDLTLDEVIVLASKKQDHSSDAHLSSGYVPIKWMEQVPTLGGEQDIFRLTHLLPGVESGADGIGGLHIRGGSADQNMILLDGVPVYNATHALGLFSIFNPNTIKSVRLLKGGFPARYGGRLSSVLDIRSREGNLKKIAAEVQTNLVGIRATLEGPLIKDKASFLVSYRRSYFNFWFKPYSRSQKRNQSQLGESAYDFYDINAKLNFKLGTRHRLYLSFYEGKDTYEDQTFRRDTIQDDIRPVLLQDTLATTYEWGNLISSFRWNSIWNPHLFSNLTFTYSNYHYASEDLTSLADFGLYSGVPLLQYTYYQQFQSRIKDWAIKYDINWVPSTAHYISLGAVATRHVFQPGILTSNELTAVGEPSNDTVFTNSSQMAWEAEAYLEDNFSIGQDWLINVGLRWSSWHIQGHFLHDFQPRLNIDWQASRKTSLSLHFGKMTQYLHLLSQSAIGLPTDLWVPTTANTPAETAWQTGLKWEQTFGRPVTFSLEAYYKYMERIVAFRDGSTLEFIDANNWESKVTDGKGYSYGLEFFLRKDYGRFRGWISYNLAWSEREFEEINFGKRFPFKYDRRHSLKVVSNYQISDNLKLTATWVYGTGAAYTLPFSVYEYIQFPDLNPLTILYAGEKNSFRLPDYHRLDIGLDLKIVSGQRKHLVHFGVTNIYNRYNPLYYRLDRDPLDVDTRRYVQVALIPILPSLSYTFSLN